MPYIVTDTCRVCREPYGCIYNCPKKAIFFNGVKAEIDQSKCVKCGKCIECCNLCAIVDTEANIPEVKKHEPITRDCDILILGGGASGIVAALKASELTDKKIIVLEKAKKAGGCGIYSAALRVFGTKWEKAAGIPDQTDDYIRAAVNTTRGVLDPQLISNCFHALPAFFDWFCQWGEAEKGFKLDMGANLNGMRIQSILRDNAGRYIMKKAIARCKERGIEILTEYEACKFILNNENAISGVVANDPGGRTSFRCKVCLVATGNLGNCTSLLRRCVPQYADAYQRPSLHLLPTCTGDGVLMAGEAGIPIDYESIVPAYLGPGCGGPFHPQLMIQPDRCDAMKINLEGKRWINENSLGELCTWRMLEQPQCVSYTIIDSKLLTTIPPTAPPVLIDPTFGRCISNGIPDENGNPPLPSSIANMGMGRGMPVDKRAFDTDVAAEVDKLVSWKGKYVVKGETLEELAKNMEVDVDTFAATVKRYNELCAKGHDDDFFKLPQYMIPIENGPFYAFHSYLPTDGTFGGLDVNKDMEVIGNGKPVPGLYAAGDTTASRYVNQGGEKKQIINDFSWAISSGFIAGENMAEYVSNKN